MWEPSFTRLDGEPSLHLPHFQSPLHRGSMVHLRSLSTQTSTLVLSVPSSSGIGVSLAHGRVDGSGGWLSVPSSSGIGGSRRGPAIGSARGSVFQSPLHRDSAHALAIESVARDRTARQPICLCK